MESFLHAFKEKFLKLKENDKLTPAEREVVVSKTICTYGGAVISEKEANEQAKKILACSTIEEMTPVISALGEVITNRTAAMAEFTKQEAEADDELEEASFFDKMKCTWDNASNLERVAAVVIPVGILGLVGYGAYQLFNRDSSV